MIEKIEIFYIDGDHFKLLVEKEALEEVIPLDVMEGHDIVKLTLT